MKFQGRNRSVNERTHLSGKKLTSIVYMGVIFHLYTKLFSPQHAVLIWVLQAIICDDGLQPELLAILVPCYLETCTVYWSYVSAWEHNLAIVVYHQNIDRPFNSTFTPWLIRHLTAEILAYNTFNFSWFEFPFRLWSTLSLLSIFFFTACRYITKSQQNYHLKISLFLLYRHCRWKGIISM